ncbi:hypothetical protein [Sphingobacterium griseoflavum]|uniref:TerB-C domain-containing protein n=1 Tax=Sphingobacterium griseoflavum TaxID=1474952 RepID=A0ABQ3I0W0_9SPHI|nr:hypothetical protein [Sphingobacterium griseoflavum]GHE39624.1 hypothetical protein GCM10017764_23600 [Sphingobacterium griseoflavum]
MKNLHILLAFVTFLFSSGLRAQVLDTNQTALSSMQATQQHLEQTNKQLEVLKGSYEQLKLQSEKLLRANDSIRHLMSESQELSLQEQKQLYETNYGILTRSFQDISLLKQQMKGYGRLLDVTYAGTLISQLNNPTNVELGTSFSKVLLDNAEAILSRNLKGSVKSKFSETIKRVVSIPLVGTIVESNPISALVKGVYDQALSFSDNAIKDQDLRDFLSSIKPYTDFYYTLDQTTSGFKQELLGYRRELATFDRTLLRHEERLLAAMQASPNNKQASIDGLFRYADRQRLTLSEIKRINESLPVSKTIRLINASPELALDQTSFEESFNNYIDQVIAVLERASKNDRLQFDASTIDKLIRNLRNTRIRP